MKLTSARKDYGIYGFMVVVFLAGTIAFFVRYGTSEIWYTLLMIVFLLVSLYFFTCTLRFRVLWDDDGIHIRQNWKPEVHYTWDDFEQMYIKDQCIMLHLNGRRGNASRSISSNFFPLLKKESRKGQKASWGGVSVVSFGMA